MFINPATLKRLRGDRGLSQQELADHCQQLTRATVSKRTIARLESNKPPKTVRKHTIESLAKALGVTPQTLSKPCNETSDEDWKELGYTPIKVRLSDDVRLNYRCVIHHYDVSLMDLIDAAPWMFTLLAEMSLAERRRRLQEADAAFEEAMRLLPDHLGHGRSARFDFEEAKGDEEVSLARRDVFGDVVLETDNVDGSFDPNVTNPFVAFLEDLAEKTGSKEINPDDTERPLVGGLPHWPVLRKWLHDLTGGDSWAEFAVQNVKIRLANMPKELEGPDKLAERIQWLVAKIPPEVRKREEKRRADAAAMLGELEF